LVQERRKRRIGEEEILLVDGYLSICIWGEGRGVGVLAVVMETEHM